MTQIATAAEEQTATTSEISNNMMQITVVVQGTARNEGEVHAETAGALLAGITYIVQQQFQDQPTKRNKRRN